MCVCCVLNQNNWFDVCESHHEIFARVFPPFTTMGSNFSQLAATGFIAFVAGAWVQAACEDKKQRSETKVTDDHKRLLLQKIIGYGRKEKVEPLRIYCNSDKYDKHEMPQAYLNIYKLTNNKTMFMSVFNESSLCRPTSAFGECFPEYSMDIAQVYGATSVSAARDRLEELGDMFLNLMQWDEVITTS